MQEILALLWLHGLGLRLDEEARCPLETMLGLCSANTHRMRACESTHWPSKLVCAPMRGRPAPTKSYGVITALLHDFDYER